MLSFFTNPSYAECLLRYLCWLLLCFYPYNSSTTVVQLFAGSLMLRKIKSVVLVVVMAKTVALPELSCVSYQSSMPASMLLLLSVPFLLSDDGTRGLQYGICIYFFFSFLSVDTLCVQPFASGSFLNIRPHEAS